MFDIISDLSSLPRRVEDTQGKAWFVLDYSLAEALIRRGADSKRIAIGELGSQQEWELALEQAGPDGPIPPPHAYEPELRSLLALPTYNEAENLEKMVQAIHTWLDSDILIIDDNSPDGTGDIADRLAEADSRVHVLHRQGKEGLGKAYISGYGWGLEQGYELLFQMDCDLSHPPWDLPRMAHAAKTADLVIGSRYVPGGRTDGWVFRRRLLSKGANLYTKIWLGFGIQDWTAGFRCYHADLLRRIRLDQVSASGYSFQVEMAYRSKRKRARIQEVPIRFTDREEGISKMSGGIAKEAIRLVPAMRFKRISRD